jgi:hypothetical protein
MQAHLTLQRAPRHGRTLMAEHQAVRRFTPAQLRVPPVPSPAAASEPECECQDVERCPVHFGYDD